MNGEQVVSWLSSPDFEFAQPFVPAFKSHGVNGKLLLELTVEDMEQELGITSRLIRKRLLQEIETLKSEGYAPKSGSSPPTTETFGSRSRAGSQPVEAMGSLSSPPEAVSLGEGQELPVDPADTLGEAQEGQVDTTEKE